MLPFLPMVAFLMLLKIWFQLPALCVWLGQWSPFDQRQLQQAPERQPLAQRHNLQGHQQPPHCQDWYQDHHTDDHRSQKSGPEGYVGVHFYIHTQSFFDFSKLGHQQPRGERIRFVAEILQGCMENAMLGPLLITATEVPLRKSSTPIRSVANTNGVQVERRIHRIAHLWFADQP